MAKICKCDKIKGSGTTLATPGVKKKNEMYLGSSASTSTSKASSKTSATMGHNGIGKSKALSRGARDPMAQYSNTCEGVGAGRCPTTVAKDRKLCLRCSHSSNRCAKCALPNMKTALVAGQKFTLK